MTTSSSSTFTAGFGLRVCHINANSLRAHIESLKFFMANHQPFHLIAISETKLGPIMDDSIVALKGYNLLRQDRRTNGGGVALYVHKSLMVSRICSSSGNWAGKPGLPEYLFCEVTPPNLPPIFAGVVYRPPHAPFMAGEENNFITDLIDSMHNYSTKVIMGDFNADQLTNSADAHFLRNLITDNSLKSIPYGATFHREGSDTALDLCLVDSEDIVTDHWKSDVPFADGHDIITATIKSSLEKPVPHDITYRDYKALDVNGFLEYLSTCNWSVFDNESSLDERLHCLNSNLEAAVLLNTPIKTLRQTGKVRQPWFTREHNELMDERNRRYRRFRRTRMKDDLLRYRAARDQALQAIEEAKVSYYHDRLCGLKDSKRIWRELKNLGLCSSGLDSTTKFPAAALNAHFSTISYDPSATPVSDVIAEIEGMNEQFPLFSFSPVTLQDISSSIDHFNTPARGSDELPKSVITAAFPFIGKYVLDIFNRSIGESIFPTAWKKSLILAVNKVASPRSMNEMRPISLLCFLSKVLERLMHLQLSDYLETCLLLDKHQTGYRSEHSTQTTLLKLTDDIRSGMDQKLVTMLLLFDFSKAFDSVSHVVLLRKLRSMNIAVSAIKWIASYLTERKQAVLDPNGVPSSFSALNKGVPQGSVLGPLLFAIYVRDICNGFATVVLYLIYADDLQIYVIFPLHRLPEFSALMSAHAEMVNEWAVQNQLKLNISKTKAIIFGSYYYVNQLSTMETEGVVLGETLIKFEPSVRSLGVILDSKLNWKEQVASICRKSYSLLYRLNFFRKSTNFNLRKHLIQALLFPILDYCSLVWCDLSNELESKLQVVANSGIRYIYGVRRHEHISPYRTALRWLTIKGRRNYFTAVLMYRMFKSGKPEYLVNRYIINVSNRPVRGSRPPLCIPPFRKEFLENSFHVSSSYLWNSLPPVVRNCTTVKSFKRCLHAYLLSLQDGQEPLLRAHL